MSSPAPPRLGALARWRAELAAGKRTNTARDFDDLQAAACNELTALEAAATGDKYGARHFMDEALLRAHGHGPFPSTTAGDRARREMLKNLRGEVRNERQVQKRRGLDARIAAGRDRATEYAR